MPSRADCTRLALSAAIAGGLIWAIGPAGAQSPQPRGVIEQEQLAPLDAWGVSGLARGERPLPRSLWRASDAASLTSLLDATPTTTASPTARSLLRDALAAPADPPRGDARTAARARVEALARLGAIDEVIALSVGPMREDAAVAMFAAQAELAKGDVGAACRRLGGIDDSAGSAFVLRMRGVCFALEGETDAALLALEIAAAKNAGDPWLANALRALSGVAGSRGPTPSARYDNSLNTAVSVAAGLPAPRETGLSTASLFAVQAVFAAQNAPASARAEAAVRLARLAMVDPNAARQTLASAIDPAVRSPARWVALVRDVQASPDATAKARALAQAIDAAPTAADAGALHRLFADDLRSLARDPLVLVGAAGFARAALAAGDAETGALWRSKADRTRSDARLVAALDAAIAVRQPADVAALRFAAERVADAGGPAALRHVLVLAALGAPLQGAAERLVMAASPSVAPSTGADAQRREALFGAFASAVERRAQGEAAVAAGALLAAGAQTLDPRTLERIVAGLAAVGLGDYARRAAIESILSAPAGSAPARPATPAAPRKR